MANFTFDDTIPAASHNPSSDQPIMLANNVASNGIIAVDHVGYNAINGGQHTAITFNQDFSYVPTAPVNPPQLFTMVDAFSLPQLRFYSGDAAHSSNQYVASGNGSVPLMAGIILKWGTFTSSAGATTITYGSLGLTPFPNNTFVVLTSVITSFHTFRVSSVSPSQFQGLDGIGGIQYYFLAVGN